MNNHTVSILIPAYNVASFLPKCMDSVLHQTYDDLQVVIIDDGSTDNTLSVCKELADKDSRIEVYHQENQGVAATRNLLLDKVKGDYVLFVDADDWIEVDMVEYLLGLAVEKDADFVMCDRVINDVTPSPKEPKVFVLDQEQAIKDFLMHQYFVGSLWNKFIKKTLIHNERFHNEISYGEDALFCWRILQRTEKVMVSDKQLYHYYMNEQSISHQSFGNKKLTGHNTWKLITEDVKTNWPKYINISQARFGIEDMYLLRDASQSNYSLTNDIRTLQKTVREYFPQIKQSGLIRFKDILYAGIICRWYGFGALYYKLHLIFKEHANSY